MAVVATANHGSYSGSFVFVFVWTSAGKAVRLGNYDFKTTDG
jgi:hypothetical protein